MHWSSDIAHSGDNGSTNSPRMRKKRWLEAVPKFGSVITRYSSRYSNLWTTLVTSNFTRPPSTLHFFLFHPTQRESGPGVRAPLNFIFITFTQRPQRRGTPTTIASLAPTSVHACQQSLLVPISSWNRLAIPRLLSLANDLSFNLLAVVSYSFLGTCCCPTICDEILDLT